MTSLDLPLEFTVTQFHPEPWTPADSLGIVNIMGFLGLADLHEHTEKSIMHMVQDSDKAAEFAKKMFAPFLDGMNDEIIQLIRKVKLEEPSIPVKNLVPAFKASNNWAVSGAKSVSGSPLYASDPHLNILQLPSIWYEVLAYTDDNYYFGVTVPGIPMYIMGRTKHIVAGFTYGNVLLE